MFCSSCGRVLSLKFFPIGQFVKATHRRRCPLCSPSRCPNSLLCFFSVYFFCYKFLINLEIPRSKFIVVPCVIIIDLFYFIVYIELVLLSCCLHFVGVSKISLIFPNSCLLLGQIFNLVSLLSFSINRLYIF